MFSLLVVLAALVVLLLAASWLDRPIQHALRTHWPAFHYDGQTLLVIGISILGFLTMAGFLVFMFERL